MKNNSKIFPIIILVLLINLSTNKNTTFGLELFSYNERCLTEYFLKQTVVVFELNSDNPRMELTVKLPEGNVIYNNMNNTSLFSITTPSNGLYSVCIKNFGKEKCKSKLTIKSGINANDFSSVAKSKDLEPIDYELEKILQKQNRLSHYNKVSIEKQNEFSSIYKSISSRISYYSLLMIAGMIMIGIMETLYLKKFMEKRKII